MITKSQLKHNLKFFGLHPGTPRTTSVLARSYSVRQRRDGTAQCSILHPYRAQIKSQILPERIFTSDTQLHARRLHWASWHIVHTASRPLHILMGLGRGTSHITKHIQSHTHNPRRMMRISTSDTQLHASRLHWASWLVGQL